MKLKDIFGIGQDTIDWRKPTSILLALLFHNFITLVISLITKEYEDINISSIIYTLLFISLSVGFFYFIRIKNDTLNSVIIAFISLMITVSINLIDNISVIPIEYFGSLLAPFILVFSWAFLINQYKRRKLALVLGYLIFSMFNTIYLSFVFNLKIPDLNFFDLIGQISLTQLFWFLEFWLGIVIFEKVLKVQKSSTANK